MKKITALSLLAGAAVSSAAFAAEPVSRDEVRSMVAEMLADAETRSSLLQGGGVAGYDKGFVVRSPDGDWSLRVNALLQFRYIANFRDNETTGVADVGGPGQNADTSDDFTKGFNLRKTYLTFSGNVVNKDLRYNIRFIQQNSTAVTMDDVFMEYAYGNGFFIRAGQFRPNFLKEQLNGEAFTLGVERGVVDSVFNQGRAQGVSFKWSPSPEFNWMLDVTNGFRTMGASTSWADADNAEYAVTSRAEWVFAGSKDDLRDYTSKPGAGFSGQFGGAVHWQQGNEQAGSQAGAGNPPTAPRSDLFAWTLDAQVEGGGLGGYAAVVGTNTNANGAFNSTPYDGNAFGLTAQGSWRWDAAPEVFVKYDGIYLGGLQGYDGARNGGPANDFTENSHFVTFGFNNYFADSAAKFTIDAIVALSRIDSTLTSAVYGGTGNFQNLGLLPSENKAGQFAIRAQFQLLF
jgi:hypothetical protein